MVYLVQGNAEYLFSAFNKKGLVAKKARHSIDVAMAEKDLLKTPFLGTETQAKHYIKTWKRHIAREFYAPGNMTGDNLFPIFSEVFPGKTTEDSQKNYVQFSFSYINDKNEPSSLIIMYCRDDPAQWMLGLTKNNHLAPRDRTVVLLSSRNLKPFLSDAGKKIPVVSVEPSTNALMDQINSPFVLRLIRHIFEPGFGKVNIHYDRAQQLLRLLSGDPKTKILNNPINFKDVSLQLLFAENTCLDVISKYQITLSPSMLVECCTEDSGLRQLISSLHLIHNEQINENILRMAIVFYEAGIWVSHQEFLQKNIFKSILLGSLWENEQMRLIPFLLKKAYTTALFQLILSKPAYYNAVLELMELGLTEDVPLLFADPNKLKELDFIQSIAESSCQKLCLVFWAKGKLTLAEYQAIVKVTTQYPLLADTLLAADKLQTLSIDGLKHLVFNTKQHQQLSILYHFKEDFDEFQMDKLALPKLDGEELKALGVSIEVLRSTSITDADLYRLLLKGEKSQGQVLRLLLPSLVEINNLEHREELINFLYLGINKGTVMQGKALPAITDKVLLVHAKELHERFISVKQMQYLDFNNERIRLASEPGIRGDKFRKIILKVEEQCKNIHERLRSNTDREMVGQWQRAEVSYRKRLYEIAYHAITQSTTDLKKQLDMEERKILRIVDPEIKSLWHQAFIIIANFFITVLSGSLANKIKEKRTGNYWFFNQTTSGEELRAMDKEIINIIEPPTPEIGPG